MLKLEPFDLVQAPTPSYGGAVAHDDELVATCVLLLFAGHETTTHHIANGLRSLLEFPAELARLRARPDLAASAVEELLRYDGPIGAQVRIVQRPQTIHGKALNPGERASAFTELAESYYKAGKPADAKKPTLAAREIAPTYARVQDLLLKLVEARP